MRIVSPLLVASLAAAVLCSCNHAEFDGVTNAAPVSPDGIIFTATFEQASVQSSKTHLGGTDNHQILWNKGDAVKIWDDMGRSGRYTAQTDGLTSDFVQSSAEQEFTPETARYAFYPEGAVSGFDGQFVSFVIPSVQTYAQNSFGVGTNFAVSRIEVAGGVSGRRNLQFTNVAGILRIQLSCSETTKPVYVSRIVLRDKSQNICGTFKVDVTAPTPHATYVKNGGQTVTLNCGANGVPLSTDAGKPTSFYITLPVGAIAQNSGFVAEVYNDYDHLVTVLKASNKDGNATIMRSHITRMSNREVKWLPKNATEASYLQSHIENGKGQVISTGVNPSSCGGIRIQMKARLDDAGVNNPSICGLVNTNDTKTWSPWISIDYHRSQNNIRACFSNSSLYPEQTVAAGDVFESDVTFVPDKFTATFNGASGVKKVTTVPQNTLPDSDNFRLFGSGTVIGHGLDNVSSSSIYSFVMYSADGTMIRNFIPVCYNGTNGMWDMVEGKFYGPDTSVSSGSFILGTSSSPYVELEDPTLVFNEFSIEGGKLLSIQGKKISIEMPYGTDLTALAASYTTNALQVLVGPNVQTSGVTVNDFSKPVTYRLKSSFGYNDWTVTVTLGPKPGEDPSLKFTSFIVPGGGMVSAEGNTMTIVVKSGADLTSLVPTFATNADKVYVQAKEQISGVTANDFSKNVVYKLESRKGINEITVKVMQFGLPTLFVTTSVPESSITKEDWSGGTSILLFDADAGVIDTLGISDGAEDIAVNEIKGRGNTTWAYPKKPYTFKLAKKAKLLGMPKEKRWNLLANYIDKTSMRNEIAFQLARVSPGLDWTPNGRFVELVMNGKHKGNYYLCEHIKISENRVNITAYDEENPAPADQIGYLFEFDSYYDEVNKFRTSKLNLPVNVKDPDVEGFDLTYISSWMNSLESKITSGSIASTDYKDLLDIDSYIDQFFIFEMTGIWEPNHPKSCYMYKDSELAGDHKIHAGPCWDFDYDSFNLGNANSWRIKDNALWFKYLLQDPVFKARLKEKWAAQKPLYDAVAASYIDAVAAQIKSSVVNDKRMWPCTGTDDVNAESSLSFEQAVARVKQSLLAKIAFMNANINAL